MVYCTEEYTKQHSSGNYWLGQPNPEFCCQLVNRVSFRVWCWGWWLKWFFPPWLPKQTWKQKQTTEKKKNQQTTTRQCYAMPPPSFTVAGQLTFNPIFFPVLSQLYSCCKALPDTADLHLLQLKRESKTLPSSLFWPLHKISTCHAPAFEIKTTDLGDRVYVCVCALGRGKHTADTIHVFYKYSHDVTYYDLWDMFWLEAGSQQGSGYSWRVSLLKGGRSALCTT